MIVVSDTSARAGAKASPQPKAMHGRAPGVGRSAVLLYIRIYLRMGSACLLACHCARRLGRCGLLAFEDMRQQQPGQGVWLLFMGQVAQAQEAGHGRWGLSPKRRASALGHRRWHDQVLCARDQV